MKARASKDNSGTNKPNDKDKKSKDQNVGNAAFDDDADIRRIGASALDFDFDLFNSALMFQNEPYCTLQPPSPSYTHSDYRTEKEKRVRKAWREQTLLRDSIDSSNIEDTQNSQLPKLKFSRNSRNAIMSPKTTVPKGA
jgi:hypothetical protein